MSMSSKSQPLSSSQKESDKNDKSQISETSGPGDKQVRLMENNQSTMQRRDSRGVTRKPVYHYLNQSDIKSEILRSSYEGDVVKIRYLFNEMKSNGEKQEIIQNYMLLGFFLAVHNQQVRAAHYLMKGYDSLRVLISALFLQYEESSQKSHASESNVSDDIMALQQQNQSGNRNSNQSKYSNEFTNSIYQIGRKQHLIEVEAKVKQNKIQKSIAQINSKLAIEHNEDQHEQDQFMSFDSARNPSAFSSPNNNNNISNNINKFTETQEVNLNINQSLGTIPEMLEIKNLNDLLKIKKMLKTEFGRKIMTRVLKIALNFKEDQISAVIVARYKFDLDDAMVNFSLAESLLLFLHNIFYYQKHLIIDYKENEEDEPSEAYLNFSIMLKKVSNLTSNSLVVDIVGLLLEWKIASEDENILQSLCELELEHIAARYMFQFPQFSDFEFFYYCLTHFKDVFLKDALKYSYFDTDYCYHSKVIDWTLNQIKEGEKFLFIMNVYLYTDFRKWNFNVFDAQCKVINNRIKSLGHIIIDYMIFDQVEEVFMEKDFKDRTVLSIICINDIKQFIIKEKLKFLLNKIWDGKDSNLIDGKTSHFSKTHYLLYHEPRQLMGAKIELSDIIGSRFKRSTQQYNFQFQMKFRKQSIELIYIKDFICATFLILMFQYINYLYLNLFKESSYSSAPTKDAQLAIIKQNLKTYKSINFAGILLSISYFISLLCRIIFNTFSKNKLAIDIWMMFDIIAGIVNIGAFMIIGNASAEQLYNQGTKRFLDYYIIVVLLISWIRFFSYFLVVDAIGKITITLLRMVQETVYFFIILCSYFLLMATIFTTLFRNANTDDPYAQNYTSLFFTIRALFDYTTGNFQDVAMGNYQQSYGILSMIHTIFSNIFLLNYLVAILQTAQEYMYKHGDYYSIQYQYNFISKYLLALEEKNGYEELILLPPPMNFLLLPLIIVSPFQSLLEKFARVFKQFMFWFENIFLIIAYLFYFLALSPYIYIKKTFLIIIKLKGFANVFCYTLAWIFLGPFYLIFTNITDVFVLTTILCLQQDNMDINLEEKYRMDIYSLVIYKDLDSALKQLYEIAQGSVSVLKKRDTFQNMLQRKKTLSQRIKQEESLPEQAKAEDVFSVSKELVFEVYKEISANNKITKYYRGVLTKKSMSSNINFFLQLQQFSADISHKYTPKRLTEQFQHKVGEYFISTEKDLSIFYPEGKRVQSLNHRGSKIPREEIGCVLKFLNKFLIQKKGKNTSDIDLELAIKVLPKKLTLQTLHKIDLINFATMQKSLVSFYHDDQDEMFNYYDERLKSRLGSLKKKSIKNLEVIKQVFSQVQRVFDFMSWDELNKATLTPQPTKQDTLAKISDEDQILKNEQIIEKALNDIVEQKQIVQSAQRSKIKIDHQFAPPSFIQRLQAQELPSIPNFYEDKKTMKRLVRTKTQHHKSRKNMEIKDQELQKKLQRKVTHVQVNNYNVITSNQINILNEAIFRDQNEDESPNSNTIRERAMELEAKRQKIQQNDENKEKKKVKAKKKSKVVENLDSKASSNFNAFNLDDLKEDRQESTVLSGKRGKVVEEIDFSNYSDEQN